MKKMCYALGNYGLTSSITNSKEISPILSNSLRVSKNIIQILKQNPNQCQIQGLSIKPNLHLRCNFNIPAMFMFSLQTSPPLSVYKQCFTRVFRFEKLKDKMFSVVFPDFFSLCQHMYKRVSMSVRVNVVMRVRVRVRVIVRVSVGVSMRL